MKGLKIHADKGEDCRTCMSYSKSGNCDSANTTIVKCLPHNGCDQHINAAKFIEAFNKANGTNFGADTCVL